MNKFLTLSLVALMFVLPPPVSAATETSAGIKPGQFLYFFDTTFEKVGLFFTFGSENKAKKALEYADERLAEAEESANENNPKAVEKAMAGYKEEISLATEKSKGLKDQNKAEELLNIVSENTSKHQEVLANVLEKVPEEAKQAIRNAIEISKRGQEEAVKQITELKGEIEQLRQELAELKIKNEAQTKNVSAPDKPSTPPVSGTTKTITPQQSQTPTRAEEIKSTKIITLPNGAVVEMDANGNVVRTIKEAPTTPETKVITSPPILTPAPVPPQISATITMVPANVPSGTIDTQNDARLWRAVTSVGNLPVLIKNIRLNNRGSVDVSAITNLRLRIDDVQFGATVTQVDGERYAVFNGVRTLDPGTHTFELIGDIIGGNGLSISFMLRRATDIDFIDKQSGKQVIPTGTPFSGAMYNISTSTPTPIPTATPTPTYEQLHCPRITRVEDSLGNIAGSGIRGTFQKNAVTTLTITAQASDPQGLPLYYRFVGINMPNNAVVGWSTETQRTFDVSMVSPGIDTAAVYVQVTNRDGFGCLGSNEWDVMSVMGYDITP